MRESHGCSMMVHVIPCDWETKRGRRVGGLTGPHSAENNSASSSTVPSAGQTARRLCTTDPPHSPHSERKPTLFTRSTRGCSVCEWEGTFTEGKRVILQKRFSPAVDGRANIRSRHTNRHVDLKMRHPPCFTSLPMATTVSVCKLCNPTLAYQLQAATQPQCCTVPVCVPVCVCPRRHEVWIHFAGMHS